ncbi:response regulator [Pedobacter chinensis]|uniref:Response regulator n=1 Tax=Pedobacter chinensis TaxID=2282421 RepID=A0A369PZR0_9SPHI|nr:response regulator [Pedobacter chinensis]RDC57984.1 response regulator [Pedobacter chinensis]
MIKKIMLVEDEASVMEATQIVLEMYDFEVLALPDAEHIFEQIETFKPDTILMDFNIGLHNGRKICDQIKANPSIAGIKVLLFSAAVNDDNEFNNPIFSNFDNYVGKPYAIDELIEKITC